MNKRSQTAFDVSFNTFMWMLNIGFMVFIILTFIIIINIYSRPEVVSWPAESEVFFQSLVFAPNGLSYFDPVSDRLYPGVIDIERLDTNVLDQLFFYGQNNDHIGAKVSLKNLQGIDIAQVVFNDPVARRFEGRGLAGVGGVDVYPKRLYVLVYDKGNFFPAQLLVDVVIAR